MPVVILEISSASGLLLSRGHYNHMGRYNRERIILYTNRNCRLNCSLSLRAFAVLMFLWLFFAHPLFSQSAVALYTLLTSHMQTNVAVLVCAMTSKFTPGAILVWVITIKS